MRRNEEDRNAYPQYPGSYARYPQENPDASYARYPSGPPQKPPKRLKRHKGMGCLITLAVLLGLIFIACLVFLLFFVNPPKVTGTAAGQTKTGQSTTGTLDALNEIAQGLDVSDETQKDGVYTILVVGTDKDGTRTDSIVMMTLNTNDKTIHMLNVPRDTMSVSAAGKIHKLNAAYSAGIDRTLTEVTNVIGYSANRYVVVDYDAFQRIIDAIGGVDIDVQQRMYYTDPTQDLVIDLYPGLQTLDGASALEYMRFRSGYLTADLGRIEAQQVLYKAVLQKICQPSILLHVKDLANVLLDSVDTNLSMGEIVWFALQFYNMDTANHLTTATVPVDSVTYKHASYVIADEAKTLALVNDGFNPYTEDITHLEITTAN